jgi:GAF domain-containing protein
MATASSASAALLENIRQLINAVALGQLPLERMRERLCQQLQEHFAVERANMWRFRTTVDGQHELYCVTQHSVAPGPQTLGALLLQDEYAEYFRCLMLDGIYSSPDVQADPCLRGMRSYFDTHGVRATLDGAFRVNGTARGIVCVEQLSGPRQWTEAEKALMRRIAARMSVAVSRLKPVPPAGPSLAD